MKRYLFIVLITLTSLFLISNSAQPGIWNAGGSGSFTLLYPEDTIAYKKIQMKSENIFMQIYNGFAVVKGDYYFKNTSVDTLKIKVGYPINNVFKNVDYHHKVNEVRVDGLYKVKGLINNTEVPFYKKPNSENENWYVWEVVFPPEKITKFTVYFLVNTNNAKITEGYNSSSRNAFIYLIETGSLWKSPIEKGNFYTQLKNKVSIGEIKCNSPSQLSFNKEKSILKFSMSNYGKTPDPNFIITYGTKIKDFNFKEITLKSKAYFNEINKFSKESFNIFNYENIEVENPYKVDGVSNDIMSTIFFLGIYVTPILFGIFIILILFFLYKKFFKKK